MGDSVPRNFSLKTCGVACKRLPCFVVDDVGMRSSVVVRGGRIVVEGGGVFVTMTASISDPHDIVI